MNELRARARDVLITQAIATEEVLDQSEPAQDLLELEGMSEELVGLRYDLQDPWKTTSMLRIPGVEGRPQTVWRNSDASRCNRAVGRL